MDTIENEPVGVEGATSSQDTSTNDTQTDSADTTESVSDSNVEDTEEQAPELLAGKYKTQEELIKAHQELEHKLGENSQKAELANLLEKETGLSASQIKDFLAQQQQVQLMQQYQNNPVPYLANQVQQLQNQMALQNEEKILNDFLNSEDGKPYQQFKGEIQEAAFHMPSMKNLSYQEIATKLFGQARATGQQDAYKKIDKKIMTQSSGVKSAPQKRISLEDMKQMSTAEMETFLQKAPTR